MQHNATAPRNTPRANPATPPAQSGPPPQSGTGPDQGAVPPHDQGAPALSGPVAMFVQVTQSLMEIIKRETSLLESRRPAEIQPLQGEKARLSAEFQKLLSVLKMNETALLGPEDSEIRRHVRTVMESFRRIVAYHARLVGRLKSVCEGVVNAIGEEANRQRRNAVPHYGRDARMSYGRAGRITTVSVDSKV